MQFRNEYTPEFFNMPLSFDLNEEDAYQLAHHVLMGFKEHRTLDDLAPMDPPFAGEKETGYFIVFLQIPEESKLSYFEIVNQYKVWLEHEISESGQEVSIEFTSTFHVGKFTPDLLLKIRQRPEVGLVVVDSEMNYV